VRLGEFVGSKNGAAHRDALRRLRRWGTDEVDAFVVANWLAAELVAVCLAA
jgi:hypothetical protein